MLQIHDLTFRIDGRPLFQQASAQIADGWKVGLIGRNGTGKSTLLRIIREEIARGDGKGDGSIRINRGARLGFVAQEAAPSDTLLIDEVLSADVERSALLREAETAEDPMRIGEIYARLADIDAYSADARAAEILVGLGFTQADLSRPIREFSGGWRMRAALGGVLFAQPDLLMLDEPTNYLDLEGAAWLEVYLRKYPHTVLIVSHDRDLLNRSVTHILAVEQTKLALHPGGYDTYLKRRAEKSAQLEAQKQKQDVQRAHLQSFVDRFKAKASKAAQAQSRVKMLEKMQDITVPLAERTTPFKFGNPEELASPILEMEKTDLGYAVGRPILRNVSLRLDMDDRIAIVGANGQGKTTLVKSIAQKLPLLHGGRRSSKNLRIGYFSQDQLDELRAGESVLEHVKDLLPQAGQAQVRAVAAQFGFGPEKVETKVDKLSGGEKVRLLLGLTTWHKPHILILDEPTSHLDIDSREALIYALNDYKGAVLLITHDTYLAEATADRLWLVKDGRASPYDGDLSDYKALVLAADRQPEIGAAGSGGKKSKGGAAKGDLAGKPSNKMRMRVEAAEKDIETARLALELLDRELAGSEVYAHKADAEAKLKARAKVQTQLDQAEAAWLAATEAMERL
ncbi:MAG: ABC-F family ATP-binding cassette domain-containing protein [Alphaproteobacteria bacterium]|nr:ABC-F family ATP-binding cassette domain-containing protein [Alphaproteobacteria bacterium]